VEDILLLLGGRRVDLVWLELIQSRWFGALQMVVLMMVAPSFHCARERFCLPQATSMILCLRPSITPKKHSYNQLYVRSCVGHLKADTSIRERSQEQYLQCTCVIELGVVRVDVTDHMHTQCRSA
jgi:hypothetical protein